MKELLRGGRNLSMGTHQTKNNTRTFSTNLQLLSVNIKTNSPSHSGFIGGKYSFTCSSLSSSSRLFGLGKRKSLGGTGAGYLGTSDTNGTGSTLLT